MRVAIVDDSTQELEHIYALIDRELSSIGDSAHKMFTFGSAEEFLKTWQVGCYDLIVLDIYMGGMTGIELAYRIRQDDAEVCLAFCTTSNEFASESFEVGARHYLRKPVTADGIARMFQRLDPEKIERNRVTALPDGSSVKLRDILYTDYKNHVITLHIKNGTARRFRTSHTEMENLLMPYGYFFAPCKGILLNFYEVASFDERDGSMTMSDGAVIPIVRRKLKDAKDAYTKFLFRKMSKEVTV